VVERKHHRVAAFRVEYIAKPFLHAPIEVCRTLYVEAAAALRKRYAYVKVFLDFEITVFVSH
jgi:hypothetical protein